MPAFVQALTPSSTKTSGAANVFVSTPAGGITAGNVIVVAIATNNTSGGSPSISSIGKPAGETNSWVALGAPTSPTTTSLAGVRTSLWAIETTVAWPGSTDYAITLSASVSAKAAVGAEFSGLTATRRGGVSTTASSTTGALTATHSSPNLDVGDLLIAASGWEDVAVGPDDTDTLDGAWSTGISTATAGSTPDTNVAVGLQWKALTGASSQTWSSTGTSTDATAILSALVGTASYVGTATLSGAGALTTSATLDAAGVAALSGSGTLTLVGVPAGTGVATLSGAGTLTVSPAPAVARPVALGGAGALSVAVTAGTSRTATLSGSGTLTAAGAPALATAAALSGAGTLTAVAAGVNTATLAGSGTLTTSTTVTVPRAAALTGAGTLTTAAATGAPGVASFTGIGTLTAVGVASIVGPHRDITVTAALEPRRYTAELSPRAKTGSINRRWGGTL